VGAEGGCCAKLEQQVLEGGQLGREDVQEGRQVKGALQVGGAKQQVGDGANMCDAGDQKPLNHNLDIATAKPRHVHVFLPVGQFNPASGSIVLHHYWFLMPLPPAPSPIALG
jgi:hypothetical protein